MDDGNTFSVGTVPGNNIAPRGNDLFPDLVKAAFELEAALCPHRLVELEYIVTELHSPFQSV